jgi:phosphatidylglycerol:prolipoprotein diacylglycerol transferase
MYPTLFRLGTFEVTSFGVLVAVAAFFGIWLFGRELRRSGLPAEASNAAIAGVLGGLFGAKIVWAIEFMGKAPFMDLLLSRGGSVGSAGCLAA